MDFLRRHFFFPDDRAGWIPLAAWRALGIIRRRGIDAIYSSNYPQSAHLAAWLVHKMTGVPWIADFRDGWTQNPAFHRPANPVLAWLQRASEHIVARDATRLVTVSPPITRHLQHWRREDDAPAETIFNGFEPEEWDAVRPGAAAQGPLEPGKLTILYAGTFFGMRRPDFFFQTLRRLIAKEPHWRDRVRFRIRCDLDAAGRRALKAARLGDMVQVLPPIPFREIVSEQLRADGTLLILERGPGADIMVSQKIFEYLAAGRPVFALVPDGAAAEVLKETGGATIVTRPRLADAVDGLSRYLTLLSDGVHPLPDPGKVRQFDRRQQAARIATLLDAMVCRSAENSGISDLPPPKFVP